MSALNDWLTFRFPTNKLYSWLPFGNVNVSGNVSLIVTLLAVSKPLFTIVIVHLTESP